MAVSNFLHLESPSRARIRAGWPVGVVIRHGAYDDSDAVSPRSRSTRARAATSAPPISDGGGREETGWPPIPISLSQADVEAVADAVVARMDPHQQRPGSPWLSSAEAVEYLRLPSRDALHRLTGSGAIPHVKQGGRCLFKRSELDEWLENHRVASAAILAGA